MNRNVLRHLWIVALQVLLGVGFITSAQAHAAYESSEPADGATVASPPSQVNADFTEPLVDGSHLEVYDPCGVRVDNDDSVVTGDRLSVSMSADKEGRYRVRFEVVSAVDGHPTSGEFEFFSSGGSDCRAQKEQKPTGGVAGGGSTTSSDTETAPPGDSTSTESASAGATSRRDREADTSRTSGKSKDPARLSSKRSRPAAADTDSVAQGDRDVADTSAAGRPVPGREVVAVLIIAALIGAAVGHIHTEVSKAKPDQIRRR